MKIGIDFDNVLFRTVEFKEFLDSQIENFLDTYPEDGVYDPEIHAERLGIDSNRIKETLSRSSKFLYEDIEDLENIDNHDLWLVTRGDPEFQKMKVEGSGVKEFFDRIVIVNSGPKDQVEIDALVDDTWQELERVDIECFHFDRSENSLQDVVEWVRELET